MQLEQVPVFFVGSNYVFATSRTETQLKGLDHGPVVLLLRLQLPDIDPLRLETVWMILLTTFGQFGLCLQVVSSMHLAEDHSNEIEYHCIPWRVFSYSPLKSQTFAWVILRYPRQPWLTHHQWFHQWCPKLANKVKKWFPLEVHS